MRASYVYVYPYTYNATHTVIENNFTVCVERKREAEKGTKEEPATDRWGEEGPGCERGSAEKKSSRVRKRERQGDRRGHEGERKRER